MYYGFDGEIRAVAELTAPPERLTAAFLTVDELESVAHRLGLPRTTVRQCREEVRYFRNSVEVGEHYSFATVKRTGGNAEGEDCIAFYVLRNLFIIVDIRDSDGSTRAQFDAALRRFAPAKLTMERLIFAFLEAMIEGDSKFLEDLEFTFSELEEAVLREETDDDFTIRLLHHKQYLLLLHNYYEQLIDIGEALAENENRLFSKEVRYFRSFAEKAERLRRNVAILREQLGQLREAYQSMLDIRLNDIMKTFTVLSAIFLPLSLIVGWYGMNFNYMPELHWKIGYPLVAALCAIVVLICIRIFKKHHWM